MTAKSETPANRGRVDTANPNDTIEEVDRHDKAVEAMQNDDGSLAAKLPKARETVEANPGPDNPQTNPDGNVRGASKDDQVKDDLAVERLTEGEKGRGDRRS